MTKGLLHSWLLGIYSSTISARQQTQVSKSCFEKQHLDPTYQHIPCIYQRSSSIPLCPQLAGPDERRPHVPGQARRTACSGERQRETRKVRHGSFPYDQLPQFFVLGLVQQCRHRIKVLLQFSECSSLVAYVCPLSLTPKSFQRIFDVYSSRCCGCRVRVFRHVSLAFLRDWQRPDRHTSQESRFSNSFNFRSHKGRKGIATEEH